jgi:hypothetical protein
MKSPKLKIEGEMDGAAGGGITEEEEEEFQHRKQQWQVRFEYVHYILYDYNGFIGRVG